ncbi:uncharacterized protein EV420DRAFT_1487397 [Desarmillaria tabescens]|uniref:Uncharacterized protein n=1 Tax=Armillaria tabescens TaxID=1929756 RepID=A0AA39MJQ7_ARMTA|nr:uncharacterized protein EV420DRAFT_1487397 [Desarmillaria tabescens]KAK0436847.1 hypothetical protein EV420DRAFT_1487397 [Desarmillaria tabescens]
MTIDSLWGEHVIDLVQLFRMIPWYWTVDTLVVRCSPRVLDRFFEQIPDMKVQLKSLHCPIKLAVCLENIEHLVALEAFGIHILDVNVDNVLPGLCRIISLHLNSLQIGFGITLLGNNPFELSSAWNTFRDTICDPGLLDFCLKDVS